MNTAEVYPGADGWRFRVKANNGEIMCTGESYVRRIDAESALKQLFGIGQWMEVVVRDHGNEVVDHYTIGRTAPDFKIPEGDLDEIYTGPMEDTSSAFREEPGES